MKVWTNTWKSNIKAGAADGNGSGEALGHATVITLLITPAEEIEDLKEQSLCLFHIYNVLLLVPKVFTLYKKLLCEMIIGFKRGEKNRLDQDEGGPNFLFLFFINSFEEKRCCHLMDGICCWLVGMFFSSFLKDKFFYYSLSVKTDCFMWNEYKTQDYVQKIKFVIFFQNWIPSALFELKSLQTANNKKIYIFECDHVSMVLVSAISKHQQHRSQHWLCWQIVKPSLDKISSHFQT